ncbi:hypothetical protein ING2E5A_0652 [Petrimonas mucosa]|jgi:hypothetical protein|uniref:Uncharacterized protein n=1 Tax=Petrimonas mucosa TaxID=1642646 RepID=A0A1G4G4L2_9BACT|nr:hypothetical protein ING2E5A_0652 [Petrimonas mucosa]SFU48118.1 hypothetical protein SAMN05216364_101628 [Porphyromonadaceae bacterium KHP3R9]
MEQNKQKALDKMNLLLRAIAKSQGIDPDDPKFQTNENRKQEKKDLQGNQ